MKKILLKGAALVACALLIGAGIGLFASWTPTSDTSETNGEADTVAKASAPIHQPIDATVKFPMSIAE